MSQVQPQQALLVVSNQQQNNQQNSCLRIFKLVCCIPDDVPRNSRDCCQNFFIDSDSVLCNRKRNYSIICVSAVLMIIWIIIDAEEGDAGYGVLVGMMGISMLCLTYCCIHELARALCKAHCGDGEPVYNYNSHTGYDAATQNYANQQHQQAFNNQLRSIEQSRQISTDNWNRRYHS